MHAPRKSWYIQSLNSVESEVENGCSSGTFPTVIVHMEGHCGRLRRSRWHSIETGVRIIVLQNPLPLLCQSIMPDLIVVSDLVREATRIQRQTAALDKRADLVVRN